MLKLLPFSLMLAAGMLLPVQIGINASLRSYVNSPVLSSFISFFVGTVSLAVLLGFGVYGRGDLSTLQSIPWWVFTGGLIGAFYVTVSLMLAPILGSTVTTVAVLAGQVIASLIIDHFGLLGFPVVPFNPVRLLGALLVVGGVVVIQNAR